MRYKIDSSVRRSENIKSIQISFDLKIKMKCSALNHLFIKVHHASKIIEGLSEV